MPKKCLKMPKNVGNGSRRIGEFSSCEFYFRITWDQNQGTLYSILIFKTAKHKFSNEKMIFCQLLYILSIKNRYLLLCQLYNGQSEKINIIWINVLSIIFYFCQSKIILVNVIKKSSVAYSNIESVIESCWPSISFFI